MNQQSGEDEPPVRRAEDEIRPVGVWVVCGLVLFVSLAFWILVAVIFANRS